MATSRETVWEYHCVPDVRFGPNARGDFPAIANTFGADSVLIITDPGLVEAGIVDQFQNATNDAIDFTLFDQVEPDPHLSIFERAIVRAESVRPDMIVGLGGGSSMDVAKVTGAIPTKGTDLLEYISEPLGGGKPLPSAGLPTVCVPTTAGTGSETSPVAVVSLPDQNAKAGISDDEMMPDAAILDPELATSLPAKPTAYSGTDALAHAIEAFVARSHDTYPSPETPTDRPNYGGKTPVTDMFARESIRGIAKHLRVAVHQGSNLEARSGMALASFQAAIAFTNAGLGAVHAMAMATGARHETPHGRTIAAVLPEVIRFNAPVEPQRFIEIAELLGVDNPAPVDAASAIERLLDDLDVETGLASLGVTEEDIDPLVEQTLQLERLLRGNPRTVDEASMERLYREAITGASG